MPNAFEVRSEMRQQKLKEQSETAPAVLSEPEGVKSDSLGLSARKRTRQSYTVYLDRNLMDRVRQMAKQRDVAPSAVLEACVKLALEQLEGLE